MELTWHKYMGVSKNRVPQNGCFFLEHPIKMGWFGGTPICGNIHRSWLKRRPLKGGRYSSALWSDGSFWVAFVVFFWVPSCIMWREEILDFCVFFFSRFFFRNAGSPPKQRGLRVVDVANCYTRVIKTYRFLFLSVFDDILHQAITRSLMHVSRLRSK